jgi:hypothetical protein
MRGLRLHLRRRIRLRRRSPYRRIAPGTRRSWPRRGAVASRRRAWAYAFNCPPLGDKVANSVAYLSIWRQCRPEVGTHDGVPAARSTRGVLDHRLGDRLAVRRDDRQAVGSYLIPGAVRRVGDIESARRPHHVGEFDTRAVAEPYSAVVEVARPGTADDKDRLRRARQRRRTAAGVDGGATTCPVLFCPSTSHSTSPTTAAKTPTAATASSHCVRPKPLRAGGL